ncbi:hypothetical protein TrRE_jg9507, partial [Triparma retinervis]
MLALGHGKDRDENRPRVIKGMEGRVLMVAGGGQHSAIVREEAKAPKEKRSHQNDSIMSSSNVPPIYQNPINLMWAVAMLISAGYGITEYKLYHALHPVSDVARDPSHLDGEHVRVGDAVHLHGHGDDAPTKGNAAVLGLGYTGKRGADPKLRGPEDERRNAKKNKGGVSSSRER